MNVQQLISLLQAFQISDDSLNKCPVMIAGSGDRSDLKSVSIEGHVHNGRESGRQVVLRNRAIKDLDTDL